MQKTNNTINDYIIAYIERETRTLFVDSEICQVIEKLNSICFRKIEDTIQITVIEI